jgi:hypothetical protein
VHPSEAAIVSSDTLYLIDFISILPPVFEVCFVANRASANNGFSKGHSVIAMIPGNALYKNQFVTYRALYNATMKHFIFEAFRIISA